MARLLRNTTPELIHMISCRTRLSELLLVPGSNINNIIGGILAKYSTIYKIDLYAACVLSNHYHLVVSTPIKGNVSLFEQNVNREIAHRVNRLINREGTMWHRRYDDLEVKSIEDALEAVIYTVTNPTKHGLVANPSSWPGITSYKDNCLSAKPTTYTFFNYTEYGKAKRKAYSTGETVRRTDYETEYTLEIKTLPSYSNEAIEKEVKKRTRKLQEEKWAKNEKFLGRKSVLAQPKRGIFPKKANKSNRPSCYTKCQKTLAEFKEELKLKIDKYNLASIQYRLGKEDYDFPEYCYFPPRHHIPKYSPI